MKNAFISGSVIGIVSILWILAAQKLGFYPDSILQNSKEWIIYTALIIPFLGLYFGIKKYKKKRRNKLCFTEAIFEGFKILAIGGLLAIIFSFYYFPMLAYPQTVDYMEFVLLAIAIGLLFTIINAFLLTVSQRKF